MLQHNRDKVKVTVAVRRNFFSLFWPSHLYTEFNITLHKKICMKLYQNQAINEASNCYQHISKNSDFQIDLSPRELKLEFDQDIFHTKHLCEVTAKSVYK